MKVRKNQTITAGMNFAVVSEKLPDMSLYVNILAERIPNCENEFELTVIETTITPLTIHLDNWTKDKSCSYFKNTFMDLIDCSEKKWEETIKSKHLKRVLSTICRKAIKLKIEDKDYSFLQ